MKIAIVSDTRYMPTRKDTAGHGMGRSNALLAEGLAKRGHTVTLFGATGSEAEGCQVIAIKDESDAADILPSMGIDVVIDAGHFHKYTRTTDKPSLARSCDLEAPPCRNMVYVSKSHAYHMRQKYGNVNPDTAKTAYDGIDPDSVPFHDGKRGEHFLHIGSNHALWKRPDLADAIAGNRPLWLIAPGSTLGINRPQLGAMKPERLYKVAGRAKALLYPADRVEGSLMVLEVMATGTPVLISEEPYSELGESGVTGYRVPVEQMPALLDKMGEIDPASVRAWVVEHRHINKTINAWEQHCQAVLDGETW